MENLFKQESELTNVDFWHFWILILAASWESKISLIFFDLFSHILACCTRKTGKNRQKRRLGLLLSSKMSQLLLIKLLSDTVRYMTLRKWPFSLCFWGSYLLSMGHSINYNYPRVIRLTLLSPQGLALPDKS